MVETKIIPTGAAHYFFHEKLLKLDLHHYKFRSGQKQKEILKVQGFLFCNF